MPDEQFESALADRTTKPTTAGIHPRSASRRREERARSGKRLDRRIVATGREGAASLGVAPSAERIARSSIRARHCDKALGLGQPKRTVCPKTRSRYLRPPACDPWPLSYNPHRRFARDGSVQQS